MAEIMVLLIFCLLIAMATIFRSEQKANDITKEELAKVQAALKAANETIATISSDPRLRAPPPQTPGGNSSPENDEYWRDLTESRGIASAARDAGLTSNDLRARGKDFRNLVDKKIDLEKALRDAAVVESATKALAGTVPTTPEEVKKAIERGLKARVTMGINGPPSLL